MGHAQPTSSVDREVGSGGSRRARGLLGRFRAGRLATAGHPGLRGRDSLGRGARPELVRASQPVDGLGTPIPGGRRSGSCSGRFRTGGARRAVQLWPLLARAGAADSPVDRYRRSARRSLVGVGARERLLRLALRNPDDPRTAEILRIRPTGEWRCSQSTTPESSAELIFGCYYAGPHIIQISAM